MDLFGPNGNENEDSLLPPPPIVPSDVVPVKAAQELPPEPVKKKVSWVPMARSGLGSRGRKLSLLSNFLKVNVTNHDGHFYQYRVSYSFVCGPRYPGSRRKLIDRLQETFDSMLNGNDFVYDDNVRTLFTVGSLAQNKLEFTVVLEDITSNRNNGNCSRDYHGSPNESDRKRMKHPYRATTSKVEISFAAKIPLQAIFDDCKVTIRALLVLQPFFHHDPDDFTDIGGHVVRYRGFHSSFGNTQSGLSLKIDVSTTIIQPGPVLHFLIGNQSVRDPYSLDWAKAKRTLKNLRIKISTSNQEYKITGLSELPCKEQTFPLKKKGTSYGDDVTEEVTVYDYFVNHRSIGLCHSANLPCINVGKTKRPIYFPLELCSLVSLQCYTKALSTFQRASLVEKSRQKPQERMKVLSDALKSSNYASEPMVRNREISIGPGFTQVEGRVLQAPRLKFGNWENFNPRNGRWNLNKKKMVQPTKIQRWAVANFCSRCDVQGLVMDLIRCGEMKGVLIDPPSNVSEENCQCKCAPPMVRVEKMFENIQSKFAWDPPQFLLCLLPEQKNSNLYGPWKKKCLAEFGIITQCISPTRVNDQYLTNVLLKINAKLGGLNSLLSIEHFRSIPVVSEVPTIILGMNVFRGSPWKSCFPSIAVVISSRQWPLISKYRASVRTQGPLHEMIDDLFKQVSEKKDEGIVRELLIDFYSSSGKRKPENIIIFRDGVSESLFNGVLNIELSQIIEACKFLDEKWNPKFLVIVVQKNHYTKFFQHGSPDNVPPGTVVDNKICHPRNYDFYLCANAGMIGRSRPIHYHVLLDEIGFTPDDLQELVHSLSYVNQRSTTATSDVEPICYAHLAATQMRRFMKFEGKSETSVCDYGGRPVPQLPKLKKKVRNSMFFC